MKKTKLYTFSFLVLVFSFAILAAPLSAQRGAGSIKTDTRILYHNGPVMKGGSNVYIIWYGNWTNNLATMQIITDFATSFGGSDYSLINTTYTDGGGQAPTGGLVYGGAVADLYSRGASLTEADVEAIIAGQMDTGGMPVDPRGIFLVIGSADIAASGFCTDRCEFHRHFYHYGTPIKYAFVGNPERCPASCAPQSLGAGGRLPTPNGDFAADTIITWLAHTLNGTLTNPLGTAWYDKFGLENSDKCVGDFGVTYLTATGALANKRLGARDYLIQQNWVNDRRGRCALSYP